MPTIVEHIPSKIRYVLVGVSHSRHASGKRLVGQSVLGKGVGLSTTEFNVETSEQACLAYKDGTIRWVPTEDIRLVSIDGVSPADALG